MPAPLFPQPSQSRSLGVLNPVRSRALDAQRFGGVVNGQPQAFNPNPARPAVAPAGAPVAVAPSLLQPTQRPQPNVADPNSIEGQNTLVNAGIYQPGTAGAANAVANGTGQVYRPPQQTERANPLTGDNNIPMESTSTRVAAPFVQRGKTTPGGQDVAPKAPVVAPLATPTDDVGSATQDTQNKIRSASTFTGGTGRFARQFGNSTSAGIYHSFVQRLFGDAQDQGT